MRVTLVVLLFLLVCAPPARAATVEVVEDFSVIPSAHADYRGSPGEANDVVYGLAPNGVDAEFVDRGAALTAGHGCVSIDEHTARCSSSVPPARGPAGQPLPVRIALGDGDDRATASARVGLFVDAGPGDDVVTAGSALVAYLDGGAGSDTLTGTDSTSSSGDELRGGPGADELHGGDGMDSLQGDSDVAAPAPDVLDGGAGSDTITYFGRETPVFVDLERPSSAGGPGEGDRLSGVENVEGGRGGNTLLGDAGPNHLSGSKEPTAAGDVIDGRGGDDALFGSPASDRLVGGEGSDSIIAYDGVDDVVGGPGSDRILLSFPGFAGDPGDVVSCGADFDHVGQLDVSDVVGRDCERMSVAGLVLGRPVFARGRFVVVLDRPEFVRCRSVVRVADERRALRSAWFRPVRARVVGVGRRDASGSRAPAGFVQVQVRAVERCGRDRGRVSEAGFRFAAR
jgi:hemolysin type calcium-binding protein